MASFQPTTAFKKLFEASYDAFFDQMHRYAFAILQSNELASEVVQTTFIKWWETKTMVNGLDEARRYLFTAVYRTAMNVIRNEKIKIMHEEAHGLQRSSESEFEDIVARDELDTIIKNTIESLPVQCKIIFSKSRLDGKKYNEIATEMNLSIKTIETQMGKALRILREKLVDYV